VFPRDLTTREREVLIAMIEHGTELEVTITAEQRARWLAQVPYLRVMGRCQCGTCPSIDLVSSVPVEDATSVVLHAASGQDGATGLGLLLFIREGALSSLEGYPVGEDAFDVFPPVSEMAFD